MDDNINDDELRFVLDHYKPGRLDAGRAWNRLQASRGLQAKSRRRLAVAASWAAAIGVAVAAGIVGYVRFVPSSAGPAPQPVMPDTVTTVYESCDADTTDVFRFDNTPVNQALEAVSRHYGVRLSASDTTKSVSGEIEASSADEAIGILEATVGVKITKHSR